MRSVTGLVLLSCLGLAGCLPQAPAWSPDGRWVAYLSVVGPNDGVAPLTHGWMLDDNSAREVVPAAPAPAGAGQRYRIWASRPDGSAHVLLLESSEPLSTPAWSPDGKAVTAVRLISESKTKKRLELLIIRGPERVTVLCSETFESRRPGPQRLPEFTPAWSPDGSMIATAHADPPGLAIIKIATGQISVLVEDAFCPAWSPDASRLAYIRRKDSDSLGLVDPRRGQTRQLLDIGVTDQGPVWTRDGQSLIIPARHVRPRIGDQQPWGEDSILLRVHADSGQIDPIRPLSADRPLGANDKPLEGVAFTIDKEIENLFYTVNVGDAPSFITWYRPRDGSTFRKFPVVDFSLPIGGLQLSPNGRLLALRIGKPEMHLSPVIFDLEKNAVSILVPDDETRSSWMALLGRTTQSLIYASRENLPKSRPGLISRSPLPLPGEIDENAEIAFRIRRLARLGKAVSERSDDLPPLPDDDQLTLDESRLFFDYLVGDFQAALDRLVRLEDASGTPERNLTLLGLRAQISLSMGDADQFEASVRLLENVEHPQQRTIEYAGGVARLITIPPSKNAWSVALRNAREVIHSEDEDRGDPEPMQRPQFLQPAPRVFPPPAPDRDPFGGPSLRPELPFPRL